MAVSSVVSRAYDFNKPLIVEDLDHVLVMGDNQGDQFNIAVSHGNAPQSLVGGSVTGYFIRIEKGKKIEDCSTVTLNGSVADNIATVILPASCYVTPCRFVLTIKVNLSGQRHAVYVANGTVLQSSTDILIDPGHTIPSVDQLLGYLATLEQAVSDAERVIIPAENATKAANQAAANANTAAEAAERTSKQAVDNANQAALDAQKTIDEAKKVIDSANTATSNATEAASKANQAASNLNEVTDAAKRATTDAIEASERADIAAKKLSKVELSVESLPFNSDPKGNVTQTEDTTQFYLGIPFSKFVFPIFTVNDSMDLVVASPNDLNELKFNLTQNGYLEVYVE